jgi:hypothetical protein
MEVREEQVSEFIGKSLQPNWIPRLLITRLTANCPRRATSRGEGKRKAAVPIGTAAPPTEMND